MRPKPSMNFLEIVNQFKDYDLCNVKIVKELHSPTEYYNYICNRLETAHSVHLACLVIGCGELTENFYKLLKARWDSNKPTVLRVDKWRNTSCPKTVELLKKYKIYDKIEFLENRS